MEVAKTVVVNYRRKKLTCIKKPVGSISAMAGVCKRAVA